MMSGFMQTALGLARSLTFASGPAKPELSHAFGLPPEKAVQFFKAKGYAFSWDWYDTYQEAHNRAFTVAKVMRMDLLQDIREAVDQIFTEGVSERTFSRRLEPKLKAKGWWGRQKVVDPQGKVREVTLGSPWRLRTIYRTNAQSVMAAGRWKQFAANADKRPFLQFVAILDNKTRPAHRLLHGKVFRIDDPIWRKLAPPLGWGCRCRLRALSQAEVDELGLKVESSEGLLSEVDRLVSEGTGELRKVTVYRDPKTGKTVSTDPGFDYNPGMDDGLVPDLKKYDPGIVREYEKEKKREGLAARIPVNTDADLAKLLTAYDRENPGIFQKGFVSIETMRTSSFMMAANQVGELKLSSVTVGQSLNPSRDVKVAIRKVGQGEQLSFNEEYSLEMLWHEIGHCRSKGWVPRKGRPTHVTQIMETLNQWVARHTYGEFMKSLGGEPAHGKAILERGLGYATWIRNFRTLLREAGIDETAALGVLRPLAVETKWTALPKEIPLKLAGLQGKPELAKQLTRALVYLDTYDDTRFGAILKEILK